MSHFYSLVILTPDFKGSLEDSLAEYNENKEVPEYIMGEVSDYDKVIFLSHYADKNKEISDKGLEALFTGSCQGKEGYKTIEQYKEEVKWGWNGDNDAERFAHLTINDHQQDYADFFKKECADIWNDFENRYKEHGEDWNGNSWRINPETGKWCEYSTYNPNSKYDWYDCNGRWSGSIKTKSGEFVDECLLGEIDWSPFKPEDYCKKWEKDWRGKKYHPLKKNVRWHYNSESVPFALVINGKWYQKGEMLWWAMVKDEKNEEDWNAEFMNLIKDLPQDSEVYNVDMHI